jgi:uncharacterized protein (DUF2252 family)
MENISERIIAFNSNRLPEMVQLKYEFMTENLFRYFRGTNHIFYERLAGQKDFPKSPDAWISGDLHLENFGTFKSDNRQVYCDLNDFDEAILAPWKKSAKKVTGNKSIKKVVKKSLAGKKK